MSRRQVNPQRDDVRGRVRTQTADRSPPSSQRREGVAAIQRAVGNQTVQRLADDGPLPDGLAVSQPGDPAEREAERVAEQVTRTDSIGPSNRPTPAQTGGERLQRLCDRCQRRYQEGKPLNCEECEATLQRATAGAGEAATSTRDDSSPGLALERQIQRARGGGRPLPGAQRSYFESQFGRDFGDVRVHTGTAADRATRTLGARAFTIGTDVVFRSEAYTGSDRSNDRLVAHELTHVVQQTDPRTLPLASQDAVTDGTADSLAIRENDGSAATEATGDTPQTTAERLDRSVADRPTIRTTESAGTIHRDTGSGSKSGSRSKQSDPVCKDFVYVIHRVVLGTRLDDWKADETAENRLEVLRELKWIHRCGSDDQKAEVKGILQSEVPKEATALWEAAGEPLSGYRGSYPGYYGGGKSTVEGLGTSESDPYQSFRYDLGSGDTARYRSGAESSAKAEASVLQTTDLLYFYGHHYAQYGSPGLFANWTQEQFFDLRFLRKHGAFGNVKLMVSTSCATICKEAVEVFAPLFPNAVILGYRKSAPAKGGKVRSDFESKIQGLQKTLFLEEDVDVNAIIGAWKSVIERHHPNEGRRLPGYYKNGTVHYLEHGKWKSMNATDAANSCKKKGSDISEAAE